MGMGGLFGVTDVLKLDCGVGCTTINLLKVTALHTYNG